MDGLDYAAIGNRIKAARKKQNLTQEQAAERCDITSSFYGNIERGDKKMSLETLAKISKGLSVSTDVLLFGSTSVNHDALSEMLQEIQRTSNEEQYKKYLLIIEHLSHIITKL